MAALWNEIKQEWKEINDILDSVNRRGRFALDSLELDSTFKHGATVLYDGFSCKSFRTNLAAYHIDNCSTSYYKLSTRVEPVFYAECVGVDIAGKGVVGKRYYIGDYVMDVKRDYPEDFVAKISRGPQYNYCSTYEIRLTDLVRRERKMPPEDAKWKIMIVSNKQMLRRDDTPRSFSEIKEICDAWRKDVDEGLRKHQRSCGIHCGLRHHTYESMTFDGTVYEIGYRTYFLEDRFEEVVIEMC